MEMFLEFLKDALLTAFFMAVMLLAGRGLYETIVHERCDYAFKTLADGTIEFQEKVNCRLVFVWDE
jgi:hypothetical protein